MLTPETLDYILNSLGVHKELQESIIREIVRKIVMGGLSPADAISETVAYQAEILQKSGVVYEDMVKIIAKKSDNLYYDIMTAFDAAEVEIFNYDDEILLWQKHCRIRHGRRRHPHRRQQSVVLYHLPKSK